MDPTNRYADNNESHCFIHYRFLFTFQTTGYDKSEFPSAADDRNDVVYLNREAERQWRCIEIPSFLLLRQRFTKDINVGPRVSICDSLGGFLEIDESPDNHGFWPKA